MTTQKALLTTKEAARYLRVSPRTLERWRRDGHGPRPVPMGIHRGVKYRREELERWIRERESSAFATA